MKNYIIALLVVVTNLATCAKFHWQGEPYQSQGITDAEAGYDQSAYDQCMDSAEDKTCD